MDWVKVMTMSLPVLFTLGCTAPPPPEPPKATIIDPLLQSEQRARDVQKTVDQNADSTRKAVDTQERGDTTP
jgi:hypothetical protein